MSAPEHAATIEDPITKARAHDLLLNPEFSFFIR